MPASLVPLRARCQGTFAVLETALPRRPAEPLGIFLMDEAGGRLWLRLRQSFSGADSDDLEVLETLEADMRERAAEMGAAPYLEWLEDRLSNALRIGPRQAVAVDSFTRVLDRLYAERVEPVEVKPYLTHLPLYSLRAAAGSLGEEMPAEVEDWVRAPEGLRLGPELFVAHVEGRSMEPRIPDGSLNLFRFHPAGSRQGRILLIERFGLLDENARYTVKRYTSEKAYAGEEEWEHKRIRLEPLNPEFEAWDVEPRDFAVVAEWLRVIE